MVFFRGEHARRLIQEHARLPGLTLNVFFFACLNLDRHTNDVKPDRQQIRAAVGCSDSGVSTALTDLVKLGILTKRRAAGKNVWTMNEAYATHRPMRQRRKERAQAATEQQAAA